MPSKRDFYSNPFIFSILSAGFNYEHKKNLNSFRLAFQLILHNGKGKKALAPVLSNPINAKKTNAELVIRDISDDTSYPAGKRKIILLCERVARKDIQIIFYESKEGRVVWTGLGEFVPDEHVHYQVAITFLTPKYRVTTIRDPVNVFVILKCISSRRQSKPFPFRYVPDNNHTTNQRNHYGEYMCTPYIPFPNTSSEPQVADNNAPGICTNKDNNMTQLPPFHTIKPNPTPLNIQQMSAPLQPEYAHPEQQIVETAEKPDYSDFKTSNPLYLDLEKFNQQINAQRNGIIQPAVETEKNTETDDEMENMSDSLSRMFMSY